MAESELRVGDHYERVRARLTRMLSALSPEELSAPVPTCPGWRVRDVLGHLVGIVEDAIAGKLQGPPTEAMTAEQVARHHDDPITAMLDTWEQLAPLFEDAISEMNAWPAAFDALSHEADICHALGRRGPSDDPFVGVMASMLASRLAGRAEVIFDGTPCPQTPAAAVQLRVSPYEFIRVAMGRRSLDQIASLDWVGDATDVLTQACVFGPAAEPIRE